MIMLKRKLTRNGVQWFDDGGPVGATGFNPNDPAGNLNPIGSGVANPMNSLNLNTVGGAIGDAAPAVYGAAKGTVEAIPTPFLDTKQPLNSLNPVNGATNISNGLGSFFQGAGHALTTQNNFQAQLAPTTELDYSGLIDAAGNSAIGNVGNENDLVSAILNQKSPSAAQSALATQTGNNVNNTAALIAGARGANSNPGLVARQAAIAGAGSQQSAIGQAATLQAQEDVAKKNLATALYGQIGNQSNGLLSVGTGSNNAQNSNLVSNYNMAQGINAQVSAQNAAADNKSTSNIIGGITGGGGSALSSIFYKGGKVKNPGSNPKTDMVPAKDRFTIPSHIKGMASIYHPDMFADGGEIDQMQPADVDAFVPQDSSQGFGESSGGEKKGGGIGALLALLNKGGTVKAMVSPGEQYLDPTDVKKVVKDGANPLSVGERIPGKPKVKGDSLKNDVVPKRLKSGGVVIPNHIMQSDDPAEGAKQFILALQNQQSEESEGDDFKQALTRAISTRKKKK